jgi:methylmalonyl-CoA mutase, C-terminal domain
VALGSKRRILLAKPGSDGQDRAANVLAHALQDAGFEVIYTGVHQPAGMMVESAIQEDADVIGLSITSGAHIPNLPKTVQAVARRRADDIMVLVVGAIRNEDISVLKELGVAAVFPNGSDMDAAVAFLREQLN